MPPVQHVPDLELAPGGVQDVRAAEAGSAVHESHHVLELVAKAKGTAGLIEGRSRPESTRERLVEKPAVEHQVERRVRGAHLQRAEQGVPLPREGSLGGRDIRAIAVPGHQRDGFFAGAGLAEQEVHLRHSARPEIEVDLERRARIRARADRAGQTDTLQGRRQHAAPLPAQELRAVGREAVQLLRRHFHDGGEELRGLLRDWEGWTAELLESHVSFPLLSYFRSQHDHQSWLAALTTILDVSALAISRIDDAPQATARLTFAMARHAVADIHAIFRLSPVSPAVDRLPRPEAEHLEAVLAASGIRLRTDDASMANFNALRARYEPLVHSLSNFLLMPLPEWIPAADAPDRWHPIG